MQVIELQYLVLTSNEIIAIFDVSHSPSVMVTLGMLWVQQSVKNPGLATAQFYPSFHVSALKLP